MSQSKALWIEEALAPEMEGKCYEHIWMTNIVDQYTICIDYYTVEYGEVYMVNDEAKQKTYDSLEDTKNQCICIGDYNPLHVYERKIEHLSKEEIKKRLFQITQSI